MGLDMYLKAKLGNAEGFDLTKGMTGACGGLFPLAPRANGMIEIGYWRKNYTLQEEIMNLVSDKVADLEGEDNCVDFELDEDDVDSLIAWCGYHEPENEWDTQEDSLAIFQEAKRLLQKNPGTKIFYYQWY